MISIEAQFSIEALEKDMTDKLQVWFNSLAKKLMDTGKEMTDRAVAKVKTGVKPGTSFGNITFDLRSSMGCGLVINNTVKETYFPFGKTSEGKAHGLLLISSIAAKIQEDIALVMVAGEKYATWVEGTGHDVITMSFGNFETEFLKEVKNG